MKPGNFEQVVEAHYADLYRFAFSLARQEEDACDLTQQTFAIFAQKGEAVRDAAKAKSWLFTTLYREFLRSKARGRRVVSMEETDLEGLAEHRSAEAPRAAEHAELREAMLALDESHREVLSLFYLDDHSYKNIAEILGAPIGTVMSRLARAREALRARLQEQPPPGIYPGATSSHKAQ